MARNRRPWWWCQHHYRGCSPVHSLAEGQRWGALRSGGVCLPRLGARMRDCFVSAWRWLTQSAKSENQKGVSTWCRRVIEDDGGKCCLLPWPRRPCSRDSRVSESVSWYQLPSQERWLSCSCLESHLREPRSSSSGDLDVAGAVRKYTSGDGVAAG